MKKKRALQVTALIILALLITIVLLFPRPSVEEKLPRVEQVPEQPPPKLWETTFEETDDYIEVNITQLGDLEFRYEIEQKLNTTLPEEYVWHVALCEIEGNASVEFLDAKNTLPGKANSFKPPLTNLSDQGFPKTWCGNSEGIGYGLYVNLTNEDLPKVVQIKVSQETSGFKLYAGSETVIVSTNDGGSLSTRPGNTKNICYDSLGTLHVGYEGSSNQVAYSNSSNNGSTWGETLLGTDGTTESVGVLCNSKDEIFLYSIDTTNNDIYIQNSTDRGAEFDSRMQIGSDSWTDTVIMSCALDQVDNIHCCAIEGSGDDVYYFNSSDWSTRNLIDTSPDDSDDCDIAVDNNNNVYIATIGTVGDDVSIATSENGYGTIYEAYGGSNYGPFEGVDIHIDVTNRIHLAVTDSDIVRYCNTTVSTASDLTDWDCSTPTTSTYFRHSIVSSEDGSRVYIIGGDSTSNSNSDMSLYESLDYGQTWSYKYMFVGEYGIYPSILGSRWPMHTRFENQTQQLQMIFMGNNDIIYYNLSTSEGKIVPGVIVDSSPQNHAFDHTGKNICVEPNGTLHVAYLQTGQDLWHARSLDNGITWSTQELNTGPDDEPVMVCQPNGNLHILYWDNGGSGDNLAFFNSTDNGQTWTGKTEVTDTATDERQPFCESDSQNNIHCCYRDATNNDIYYVNSSSWGTQLQLDSGSNDERFCTLTIDENDNVYVGMLEQTTDDLHVFTSKDGFSSGTVVYAETSILSTDEMSSTYHNDQVYYAFSDNDDLILCNVSTSNLANSDCKTLDSTTGDMPDISILENGTIHIMYSGLDDEDALTSYIEHIVSYDNGANFETLDRIAPGYAAFPSMADSYWPSENRANRTLHFVYMQGLDDELIYNNFTFSTSSGGGGGGGGTGICDSGDTDSTCTITSYHGVQNGTVQNFTNLVIQDGGGIFNDTPMTSFRINVTGTLTIQTGGKIQGNVNITAQNINIQTGGVINASQLGYRGNTSGAGSGPGGGADGQGNGGGGGAGYGGTGGAGAGGASGGSTYGSFIEPVSVGSGGGTSDADANYGGNGGGLIIINVTETLTINGDIITNGGDGQDENSGDYGGGGSGGGIYIVTNFTNGTGTLQANGGDGGSGANDDGGGGGGGRIAIFYYNNESYAPSYQISGGSGNAAGVQGTVTEYQYISLHKLFTNASSVSIDDVISIQANISGSKIHYVNFTVTNPKGTIVINNINATASDRTIWNSTAFPVNFYSTWTYNVIIQNNLSHIKTGSGTLSLTSPLCDEGGERSLCVINTIRPILNNSLLNYSNLTIQNGGALFNDTPQVQFFINASNIIIESGGRIVGNANITAVNLTIESGGLINASNLGFNGSQNEGENGYGPGGGVSQASDSGGGGGHGGNGGDGTDDNTNGQIPTGGIKYGSLLYPTTYGSGGGGGDGNVDGGYGGGRVYINVSDTLIVNGVINASGQNGEDGAGSASVDGGGGGAGGSIYLRANTFQGSGKIVSRGGEGGDEADDADGAGGGGGRIALYYSTKTFTGEINTTGGSGQDTSESGNEGTVIERYGDDFNNITISSGNITLSQNFNVRFSDSIIFTNKADLIVDKDSLTQLKPGSIIQNNQHFRFTTSLAVPQQATYIDNGTLSIAEDLINISGILEIQDSLLNESEIIVQEGGRITHSQTETNINYSANITAGNITIVHGGHLDVSAKGYQGSTTENVAGQGEGGGEGESGDPGAGGGHGGKGGDGNDNNANSNVGRGGSPYGKVIQPVQRGSGGGGSDGNMRGGNGGGAVFLNISDTLIVNGTINASGQNGQDGTSSVSVDGGGGGAGGSIYIRTNIFDGNGTIFSKGGSGGDDDTDTGDGGGGGGGRIAIHYTTKTFNGKINATGGSGRDYSEDGYEGTAIEAYGKNHRNLTLQSGNFSLYENYNVSFINSLKLENYANLTVDKTSLSQLQAGSEIINNHHMSFTTLNIPSDIIYADNGTQHTSDDLTNVSGTLQVRDHFFNETEIIVQSTGTITTLASSLTKNYSLNITSGNLTILHGGQIAVDKKGFPGGSSDSETGLGPGAGGSTGGDSGAGGGHGGKGADGIDENTNEVSPSGGTQYGSFITPVELGSGGGGGDGSTSGGIGGGALFVNITDTLIVNGTLNASGQNGQDGTSSASFDAGGGGAGGSIYIRTNIFDGNGTVFSKGGNGGDDDTGNGHGGGGAGGRIAIHYTTKTFNGKINATGGTSAAIENASHGSIVEIDPSYPGNLTISSGNITITQNYNLSIKEHTSIINYANITIDKVSLKQLLPKTGILNHGHITFDTTLYVPEQTYFTDNGTQSTYENLVNISGTLITADYLFNESQIVVQSTGTVTTHPALGTHVKSVNITAGNFTLIHPAKIVLQGKGNTGGKDSNVDGNGQGGGGGHGSEAGSGAGYGGAGGLGDSGDPAGSAFGSLSHPIDPGSGGGAGDGGTDGGDGGGALFLNITDTAIINGTINVSGLKGEEGTSSASIDGAGGGAGGSIFILTHILKGNGTFDARGGNGGDDDTDTTEGGGGGGGRVSLVYRITNQTFSGEVLTQGGTGPDSAADGSPGTYLMRKIPQIHNVSSVPYNTSLDQNTTLVANVTGDKLIWVNFTLTDPNSEIRMQRLNASKQVGDLWNSTNFTARPAGAWTFQVVASDNYSFTSVYTGNFSFDAGSTCFYSGSGNWEIDPEDECIITTAYNLGGNKLIIRSITSDKPVIFKETIRGVSGMHFEGTGSDKLHVRCEVNPCFLPD